MSQGVMISIQPKWCALIANGEKTLEVRKSRPKLDTPFQCYIYCTKYMRAALRPLIPDAIQDGIGMCIGEFTCDKIECVGIPYPAFQNKLDKRLTEQACVTYSALHRYCYHDSAYFWHISNLKIYDSPKELTAFTGLEKTRFGMRPVHIVKPPQSWRYVVELRGTENE